MSTIVPRGRFVLLAIGCSLLLAEGSRVRAQLITIGPAPTASPVYSPSSVYFGGGPPPFFGPGAALFLAVPPGLPPAPPGAYVVDALSTGNEAGDTFLFSVAPGTVGLAGSPVAAEGLLGTAPTQFFPGPPLPGGVPGEVSGDIFSVMGPVFGVPMASPPPAAFTPIPPLVVGPPTLRLDEFAMGLNAGPAPFTDNLNGLAVRAPAPGPADIYFSLSAAGLVPMPFTAATIIHVIGLGVVPWAFAPMLGLDTFGVGTDDLDALIVQDLGIAGTYDAADFVAFSLTPGSATLGAIGASPGGGDLLIPPPFGIAGLPAVLMPAAAFGLALADNLDAIDIVCSYPLGDVNFDGVVDIFDVNFVSSNWGGAGPAGDANGDGMVNIFDINVISSNWGARSAWNPAGGAGSAVPEPSATALCLIGSVSMAVAASSRGMRTSITRRRTNH